MDAIVTLPWGYLIIITLTMGGYLLTFVLIPRILLDRRGPEATMAWILAIALLPYIGAAIFYLFGRTCIRLRVRKRRLLHWDFLRRLDGFDAPEAEAERLVAALPEQTRSLSLMSTAFDGTLLSPGNRVQTYIDGNVAYTAMEEAIENAQRHVHLMSYIYRADTTGRRFRDLLSAKAQEGVEVRLLVDGFGGSELNGAFIAPLLAAGARFGRFSPMFLARGHWRPNLRNHRKILIVDGTIGFTGGLNIGDEYANRKHCYAPWRDTHLQLEGPAARQLQEIFADDWLFSTGEDLTSPDYFPVIPACGPDLVQVIASGPDREPTIHRIFFTAINQARKRLDITTAYFVPDPAVLLAIKAAAWRGVAVNVLVPGRSDSHLVRLAGRSYYPELLEAGVRIYEHKPGILHAKTLVIDGIWSTIGSANMDIRSFLLNYEANVLVWSELFAQQMIEIFLADLTAATPVTLSRLATVSRPRRLAEAICRALSPVL
ncbi:cardiolipin synthase A/B [Desulfovibrionales bacterium]